MFSKFVKTNEKIDYNILEKIKEKYPDKIPVIVREIHPDLSYREENILFLKILRMVNCYILFVLK